MRRNVNIKSLNTSPEKFFRLWLEFLKPFHKMTNKEMDVVSYVLHRRHMLMSKIKDEKIVNDILFNRDMRDDIKNRMGYTTNQVLSNMLTDLRKKKIIMQDNGINKNLIPNYEEGSGDFKLVFNFIVKNENR